MSKTIKGARLLHKRSDTPGVVPTIPENDDHTTGWLPTDIYVGELYINTSSSEPKIWFRNSNGLIRLATLDNNGRLLKDQLTSNEQNIVDNHTSTDTIITTINENVQYININCISESISINAISDVNLDNLETTLTNVYYISLYMEGGGTGCNLTTNIRSTDNGIIITESVSNYGTLKKGICLMWNGTDWIIISNTTN